MTFKNTSNIKVIQKICLAGLFAALACILNKVLAINYLPAVPFVRISFGGPAIIIFSSIFLGPFYGAAVGGLSDFLGYLIFDIRQYSYSPTITCTYILLGLLPYFIFLLVKRFKNEKKLAICTYFLMGIIGIGASLFLILNNTISWWGKEYNIELWMKILFPCLTFLLLGFLIFFTEFSNKKLSKKEGLIYNPYQVSLSCFIIELFIMTLFGSFMKSLMPFTLDLFPLILYFQFLTLFFNVFMNSLVTTSLLSITRKYFNGK